jgi:uncharacterized membrane-anchored protein YitT (DUF2179 family)
MFKNINWLKLAIDLILMILGALLSAVGVIIFQAPFDIAPGGISGIALILNELIATPIGLMVILLNIPIQILAFRLLGGWRVIAATVFATVLYSVLIDVLSPILAGQILSQDRLLNALYGGIVGGVGGGLVFRAGGTLGGTSTLGRILQEKWGIPLSSSTLYTDTIVIGFAGLVFGWEGALYAIVTLFVGAAVADYVLEGPSVIRTATIITDHPLDVSDAVMQELGRGVTAWEGRGMFTSQAHSVLFVTIGRQQVNRLRALVLKADPQAFIVIGQGQIAYGRGFRETRVSSD